MFKPIIHAACRIALDIWLSINYVWQLYKRYTKDLLVGASATITIAHTYGSSFIQISNFHIWLRHKLHIGITQAISKHLKKKMGRDSER